MKARIFNIMQYERHPETGEKLLEENTIKKALEHKTIKQWAYIVHDKDKYTEEEEAKGLTYGKKAGDEKGKHFHIACRCDCAVDTAIIAKWFNIPENFVDVPKGRGAFLDCVEYLTHESEKQQAKGKHRYEDEEVKSNFEWREELDKRAESRLKYGRDLDPKKRMFYDVLYNGKTLEECETEDRILYMENLDRLKKLRLEYLKKLDPPANRINYYVCGEGGIGKGLISRAIARSLFPNIEKDCDLFFNVGDDGVSFDGYDGQPVIIWNDRRAVDLIRELGGRGAVFNVFDTHPTKIRQNIKYGDVNLVNVVNIVNGPDDYIEFLNGLAGDYVDKNGVRHVAENKKQSYRRFPFIIPVHVDDFDMLLNKGFVDDKADYTEYIQYNNIRGNMRRIAERLGNNEKLLREVEARTVKPITDKHKEVMEKLEGEAEESEEDILKEFENYGKIQLDLNKPPKDFFDDGTESFF